MEKIQEYHDRSYKILVTKLIIGQLINRVFEIELRDKVFAVFFKDTKILTTQHRDFFKNFNSWINKTTEENLNIVFNQVQ